MAVFAKKETIFFKKREVFNIYVYPANDIIAFVANCGLNEQKSKEYMQEQINKQDDVCSKALAERDQFEKELQAAKAEIKELNDKLWNYEMEALIQKKRENAQKAYKKETDKALGLLKKQKNKPRNF